MNQKWEPPPIGRKIPAYAAVAEEIRSAIVRGDLNEGDRLPTESEMAARFNVSRGTLREALRTLASMNLITTTRGVQGGSFVTIPSPEQLIQHLGASLQLLAADSAFTLESTLEARKLLEVPALNLVAERASDAELAELTASIHRHTAAGVLTPNQSFHVRIARATHNPMLETMLYAVFEVHNLRLEGTRVRTDLLSHMEEEHELVADALRRRDAKRAQEIMAAHFRTIEQVYLSVEAHRDLASS